ncbi:MAG: imidazole glycerol phosphate synthase subunit HisF [Rhodospirillaceae bacterium]|nr:imidazole glycerol phosphate synthase subunit HisF [Rhodospirillaceae bacterium]
MLKTRIMPVLLFKEMTLVKGRAFDAWRRVEVPQSAIRVFNMRGVDELVFLDITATLEERLPDFSLIDDLADDCFMPFTVGGGVRDVDTVGRLLEVGADKVAINTAAVEVPGLIADAANRYGSQCIVAAIDYRGGGDRPAEVFVRAGHQPTGIDPVPLACRLADEGAGEILLTSIERDGMMMGYDVDTAASVNEAVNIPVIAAGGCGSYQHMADVLAGAQVGAVAASSIFHFSEMTPRGAKNYLAERGFPVRQ